METIRIWNKKIGQKGKCFVIGEAGSNHDGKLETAKKLIDAGIDAEVDAVKFQTFKAKGLYVKNAGKCNPLKLNQSIYDIVENLEMPFHWIGELLDYCKSNGIVFFSTVTDESCLKALDDAGVPAFKIDSYSINHSFLLKQVAKKGKPVIFSTGGSTIGEVENAVNAIKSAGNGKIAMMHAIIKYPAPENYSNLAVMETLSNAFNVPVGFSDHTLGWKTPGYAVALGAKLVEKHFTLDKKASGPDHKFALNPAELKKMVSFIRESESRLESVEKIFVPKKFIGSPVKKAYDIEMELRNFAFRGIFSVKKIRSGEKFSMENIAVLRPGELKQGIDPKYFELLLKGFKATRNVSAFMGIQFEDILTK